MPSLGHKIQKEILRSSSDDKEVFSILLFFSSFNLLDRKYFCFIKAGIIQVAGALSAIKVELCL